MLALAQADLSEVSGATGLLLPTLSHHLLSPSLLSLLLWFCLLLFSLGRMKGSDRVHEERWKRSSEAAANAAKHGGGAGAGRALREVTLGTPIR